eukprot:TRINITY_DN5108_c0_g1_i1.p1 TRINITY_DN5108_c0_g1~~TRINITY_DN5108_c0_g1_i1.p1  ORF type:complete len:575 (+),score=149.30 TRINITY_DN5108_c0_g1_i1:73-1725(+)
MANNAGAVLALLCLVAVAAATAVKYPVDASWFANRWTLDDWRSSLTQFQEQGGSIVWQRGANFRVRPGGPDEINNDPDYVWCVYLENCVQNTIDQVEDAGLQVANWFTYANDENYNDDTLLKCPGWDIRIDSSRVYHRLIVPHDSYSSDWDCTFKKGQSVDVIFTLYNGIDPHALLLEEAQQLGMGVYMPQPCVPSDTDQRPAYYEFTQRVMKDYEVRYGKYAPATYLGVYQTNEAWLGDWYESLCDAYEILSKMVHDLGHLFVISPYVDINKSQVGNASVAQQKEGFKACARSGCDIIAVQEGRGCAKGAYWWNFQRDTPVINVDPVLDDIVHYLDPTVKAAATFGEEFSGSNQDLFKAFEEAVVELNSQEDVKTELWLNLEAFEYLRDQPCLPVDTTGNGMSELIDRTSKQRIDWGLAVAGARPTKMISFAWDADYLCTDGGYKLSLSDEIKQDWDRPIISLWDGAKTVLGFNIATAGITFNITCASGYTTTVTANSVDAGYGTAHNRSPLLQQATINFSGCASDAWKCVQATNKAGKLSYHEWCFEQ